MTTALIALMLLLGQTPPPAATPAEDYAVGVGDVIAMTVFGEPDASRPELLIEADGSVDIPHLGRVKVAGKTARQIQEYVESEYVKRDFYKNPSVSITVKLFKSQTAYVVGQVNKPASLQLTGNLTVIDAIFQAGGFNDDAGSEVLILRRRPGESDTGPAADREPDFRIKRIDIEEGRQSAMLRLRAGDTVRVPKADVYYVTGNVQKPGTYILKAGLTVWQAVAAEAGGLTERASKGRIQIKRLVNGKEVTIDVKNVNTHIVQANDTIVVRNRRF